MNKEQFFKSAFQRSLGLLTEQDQALLRNKSVGIAGLGGVGGSYVLSLCRIGIGKLVISDFDHFEIANFNRQAGAMMSTLGKSKAETIKKMALDINPHMEIVLYSKGIDENNIQKFVSECDVVIDAIDFYCIDAHRMLHREIRNQNKYGLFSIPFGFSATMQIFSPHGMSFEDYYDFVSCKDYFDEVMAFALGSAPKGLHWPYYNLTGDQLAAGTPSSINCSVNLCTGVIVSSVVLIFLGNWEESNSAPHFIQMDTRVMKLAQGRLNWGNRGPMQLLKRWIGSKKFGPWRTQINQRDLEKKANFLQNNQTNNVVGFELHTRNEYPK